MGKDERILMSYNGSTKYPSAAGRRKVGISFTRDEIKEISIAIGILTLVFAFAFSGNGLLGGSFDISALLYMFPFSLIAVLSAFAMHELSHKIAGNHFGYPAGFTYSKRGLYFALFMGVVLGFAFAAPGAVIIYGRPTKRENGIISLAGPLSNLIMGSVFFFIGLSLAMFSFESLGFGIIFIALINFFIGLFNMIPIMPFDGSKIWKWSKLAYIILLAFLLPPVLAYFILPGLL